MFGMGDGRVVPVATPIETDVLRRLAERDDGEVVEDVDF
jgi:hypothetical protein